jgi:hypothetical protein
MHLGRNYIYAEGAKHLATALQTNKVKKTISALLSDKLTVFIHDRRLQHWILLRTILLMKVQSIWQMHFKPTQ